MIEVAALLLSADSVARLCYRELVRYFFRCHLHLQLTRWFLVLFHTSPEQPALGLFQTRLLLSCCQDLQQAIKARTPDPLQLGLSAELKDLVREERQQQLLLLHLQRRTHQRVESLVCPLSIQLKREAYRICLPEPFQFQASSQLVLNPVAWLAQFGLVWHSLWPLA